jgi:WD40 repeat protein
LACATVPPNDKVGAPFIRLIKFWDIRKGEVTGELREEFGMRQPETDTKDSLRSITYSHDGKTLAAACGDGKVVIYDVVTRKAIKTIESGIGGDAEDKESISKIAFSPNGETLAICGNQRKLKLFNAISGKESLALEDSKVEGEDSLDLGSIAFSPEGDLLAVGYRKGRCVVFDTRSGKIRKTLKDLKGPVTQVAFSPDGKMLATGMLITNKDNKDDPKAGEVRLWPVAELLK